MSHISTIKRVDEWKIPILRSMCSRQGWAIDESKKTFIWYGQPKECEAVIRIPGCDYEIGVVKDERGEIQLEFDSYARGGLGNVIGVNGGKLKQTYDYEKCRGVVDDYRLRWFDIEDKRKDWRRIRVEV